MFSLTTLTVEFYYIIINITTPLSVLFIFFLFLTHSDSGYDRRHEH